MARSRRRTRKLLQGRLRRTLPRHSRAVVTSTDDPQSATPGRLNPTHVYPVPRCCLFQIGVDGRTVTTAFITPGQVFGEMAALGQQLDQTWAETAEPCVVCLMSRQDVQRLRLSDPRIAVRVAEFLGSRVADLERRLGDTVLKPAPARIAANLARLGADGAAVRLTHSQLADLVGRSRETTTKVLGDLADRGLVSLRGGRIIVRSPHALADLADSDSLTTPTGGSATR